MIKLITALFSEKGDISMMRLLSLICVVTASGIAIYAVINNRDVNAISVLCGTFLGAGITGKIFQKMSEAKDVRK